MLLSNFFILLFFLSSSNTASYTEKRINLSFDLIPKKEYLQKLNLYLEGTGQYEIYCRPINNPGIKIEYSLEDSIFKPLTSNIRILAGTMPKSGKEIITLILCFVAPFNLLPNDYHLELLFQTSGSIKFGVEKEWKDRTIIFQNGDEPQINLGYSLKDRIKLGDEMKVKGFIEISRKILTKGIIKLHLPQELEYQKNSFRFNGEELTKVDIQQNTLFFEINDIEPGIYDFEYWLRAKPWSESKTVFIAMGVDAWLNGIYIESAEIVHQLYLEADVFY